MRIESDPMTCRNCGDLDHDGVETRTDVPRLDPESYAIVGEGTDVYVCSGCGSVLGVR